MAQPSQAEREAHAEESATLQRYLRYVSKCLLLYPRLAPSRKQRSKFDKALRAPGFKMGAEAARDALPEPPTYLATGSPSEQRGNGEPRSSSQRASQAADLAARPGTRRAQAVPAEGPPAPPRPPSNGHQFKWIRRRWACQKCLRRTWRDPPFLAFQCAGHNQVLSELVSERRGHALFVTSTPDGILFVCMKCGCISEGVRISGLSAPCNTRPVSAHTRSNLKRIREGQHPSHARGNARVLEELIPVDDFL